jgi:hypothetical protein
MLLRNVASENFLVIFLHQKLFKNYLSKTCFLEQVVFGTTSDVRNIQKILLATGANA